MTMMGLKERAFAPKVSVSLKKLVPQDHFYRHLERELNIRDMLIKEALVKTTWKERTDDKSATRPLYCPDRRTVRGVSDWDAHQQMVCFLEMDSDGEGYDADVACVETAS
jgi:hypothetical protein